MKKISCKKNPWQKLNTAKNDRQIKILKSVSFTITCGPYSDAFAPFWKKKKKRNIQGFYGRFCNVRRQEQSDVECNMVVVVGGARHCKSK